MTNLTTSVLGAFDFVWHRLSARVTGLDDDEYFWQPVPGSWTLRREPQGTWVLDGDGGGGPAPDPAPVTTIAWRMCHIGLLALGGFTARRFPDLAPDDDDDLPAHAADALVMLEQSYARWRQGVAELTDDEWHQPLGPDWGPYADDTTLDLVLHVLDELVHHGAEVSLLRDLYGYRDRLGESAGA